MHPPEIVKFGRIGCLNSSSQPLPYGPTANPVSRGPIGGAFKLTHYQVCPGGGLARKTGKNPFTSAKSHFIGQLTEFSQEKTSIFKKRLLRLPTNWISKGMKLRSKQYRGKAAGFSLIETMASITLISICSAMVVVDNSATDATQRLDRAADEVVSALRYARAEAMGHGELVYSSTPPTTRPSDVYGVSVDTTNNKVTVYHSNTWNAVSSTWGLPGTAVSSLLYGSGTYVIDFNKEPEVEGVTISAVNLTGTSDTQANTASPYVCQYLPMGECENYGSATAAITLSYGGYTRTITVPQIGDASKN